MSGPNASRTITPVSCIRNVCQRQQLCLGKPRSPYAEHLRLRQISAGHDLFSVQYDGSILAAQFSSLGVPIRPANTHRVQGWAAIQQRLGHPAAGIKPTLFIHERCRLLLDCLPFLQHDPGHPADILKTNVNDEGLGGDDAADALRYLVATRIPWSGVKKLRGL